MPHDEDEPDQPPRKPSSQRTSRRSEEIRALANRMGAYAASLLFTGMPGVPKDIGQSSDLLHEYAADVAAREEAAGRDIGRELAVLLSANGSNTRLLPGESPAPPATKKPGRT